MPKIYSIRIPHPIDGIEVDVKYTINQAGGKPTCSVFARDTPDLVMGRGGRTCSAGEHYVEEGLAQAIVRELQRRHKGHIVMFNTHFPSWEAKRGKRYHK